MTTESQQVLSGKVAIVTGGASGIARATSIEFSRNGCAVVVADVDGEGAERVASEIESSGGRALPVQVDVTDVAAVNDCVSETLGKLGSVDVLVSCAGFNSFVRPEKMTDEQWRDILAVNLDGHFYMNRAVMRPMMESRSGKIVNISSGAGLFGIPKAAHYTAAKHGVIGLTKALAADLGPYNINVNAICPGTVLTPLLRKATSPEFVTRAVERYPLGRLGQPEDIASAALFLASPASDWITGVALPVDGGLMSCIRVRHWGDEE